MVLAVVYCVCKQIMAFQAACKRFVYKQWGACEGIGFKDNSDRHGQRMLEDEQQQVSAMMYCGHVLLC